MTGYDGTIDRDDYWADADAADREGASPASHHAADVLCESVAEAGAESVADVGCGAGAAAFDVAERHPEVTVIG